jgi:hypothetical protein
MLKGFGSHQLAEMFCMATVRGGFPSGRVLAGTRHCMTSDTNWSERKGLGVDQRN